MSDLVRTRVNPLRGQRGMTHHASLGRSLLRLEKDGFLMTAYGTGQVCSRKLHVGLQMSAEFSQNW